MNENPYRGLASVDRLLAHPVVERLAANGARPALTGVVRAVLDEARRSIAAGAPSPTIEELAAAVQRAWAGAVRIGPRRVINATGVVIHTNLGRAPLSEAAIAAIAAAAADYCDLEFDLEEGERGSRMDHVEALLRQVSGAEAAIAVNNNAAAVFMALAVLAAGRDVIVSRGQAVEIGGGFRIPDVLRQSGALLVEVGTTNRTYLRDYEDAIGEGTAALLRVHRSNFRIVGFAHDASLAELAELARRRGVALIDDLGSGCLLDTTAFGLAPEPRVQESVSAGAGLVCFSGDKLLGGPQAGAIVGRREAVDRLRRHPLARALRPDKATLAALGATLLHYVRGEALTHIPVWRMIAADPALLRRRARRSANAIGPAAATRPGRSMIGGGSLPEEGLPTTVVAVAPPSGQSVDALAAALRAGDPPVVGRIEDDRLLLDPRTIPPADDRLVAALVRQALRPEG